MVETVGRFCFRRRRWVIALWFVITIGGMAMAGPLMQATGSARPVQGVESDTAQQVLRADAEHGLRLVAVWEQVDAGSDQVRGALDSLRQDLAKIPGVKDVAAPLPAADGRGVAVVISLERLAKGAEQVPLEQAGDRARRLAAEVPGSTVALGGRDLVSRQVNDQSDADLLRAELLSLPITLVLLFFVFRGLVAATVPLLGAIATMAGAFGSLMVFSLFVDLDNTVLSVVALMGLGLSIDYGLLLVSRYREELAAGLDRPEAIARTWATVGRTIMFSGLTVACALSGLLLFDLPRMRALGAAGISAAVLAMLVALTMTPALLGVLGRGVRPSKREMRRRAAAQAAGAGPELERGLFARLARFTQRRAARISLVAAVGLGVLAAPLLLLDLKLPEPEGLPRSLESVQVNDVLVARYGLTTMPDVQVVARTDAATLNGWAAGWAGDPAVARVEPAVTHGGDLSTVVLVTHGGRAEELVERLRQDRPDGYPSWVTGNAAVLHDIATRTAEGLPRAILVTVLAMLVLLFIMTRSVLVPVKAMVMNLLSLGATFGILVLVFQFGWLSQPLNLLTVGGLSPYLLVTVCAFGFGFSMDYEMFLLGRIKEYVDGGMETGEAVRRGLQSSGRILTSAALLMLVVFACFGTARVGDLQQLGIGLFVAVLLDATIVRCLLVPATMTLLGRWNWWSPVPVRWWQGAPRTTTAA